MFALNPPTLALPSPHAIANLPPSNPIPQTFPNPIARAAASIARIVSSAFPSIRLFT